MLYFENDYSEGAHKKILQRLLETNMEHLPGYGSDPYCSSAKEKIRSICHCPQADVYFLCGGTQTNQIVICSMLRQYEGVLAAVTGHISTHEAGAIETTGHKVLSLPQKDGKIIPSSLETYLETFYSDENHEHMVFPGMVYLSHPTEYGTLYTKDEMTAISEICRKYTIPLYLDGARLITGLSSPENQLTFADIARLCDVFYIGGTKAGTLCGEAVVFPNHNAPSHFMTIVKQHGALLAKGRLLGIQFDALFTGRLYEEIGRTAIETASILKKGFQDKGYTLYNDSPTNQIFVVLEDEKMEKLKKNVVFSFWEKADKTHTIVRFATSWATKKDDIQQLLSLL